MPDQRYRKPVLIVDDEVPMADALHDCLEASGYTSVTCNDPLDAANLVRLKGIEIVVLDIQMPRLDGLELLAQLRELDSNIAAIVMTAHGSIEKAVEAMQLGAYDFLSKPFSLDVFVLAIRKAVERIRLVRQNATLADQVRRLTPSVTMIGSSESLSRIRDVVRRVAASDVTLLITGESGTGKELVADDLIKSSNRTAKPFVKINCAALPETLLESELFGHERGAFTGAVSRQIGKFEMADGGSLFLDEVGEMSMTTQTKLLRIIQEKTFQRLGGHENIQVDVRLIAATNKDLLKEIRAGNFREDLYYRLNVIEVELPPLRERADDIPPLLEHFVRYFAEKHGKEPAKISSGAKRKLSQFSWPGNIRQLKNYVERITLLDLGKDLDADVNVLVGNSGVGKSVNAGLDFGGRFDHIVSLDEAEALYIRRVLEETKGNRTHAAQILKIDPKTLRAKLKKAKSVGITSDGE